MEVGCIDGLETGATARDVVPPTCGAERELCMLRRVPIHLFLSAKHEVIDGATHGRVGRCGQVNAMGKGRIHRGAEHPMLLLIKRRSVFRLHAASPVAVDVLWRGRRHARPLVDVQRRCHCIIGVAPLHRHIEELLVANVPTIRGRSLQNVAVAQSFVSTHDIERIAVVAEVNHPRQVGHQRVAFHLCAHLTSAGAPLEGSRRFEEAATSAHMLTGRTPGIEARPLEAKRQGDGCLSVFESF